MASSLPARAVKIVDKIARMLAESGQGVVYDPQADQIVWPSNPKKLREVRAQERSEDDGRLELEWLWTRRLTSKDARSVLDIFRRDLPEAVPVRFGTYEPMQGRLDRDGEDAFAELWDGVDDPFWKGTRPFDYGHVCLGRGWGSALSAEERDAMRPLLGGEKAPEVDAVTLQFRTEVIDDARWLGAIRSLFERVCDEFSPFFAAAYLSPDRNAEMVALRGRWWLGVPSADFWLLYVGQVYELFLPPAASRAARTGHGVLVTLARTRTTGRRSASGGFDGRERSSGLVTSSTKTVLLWSFRDWPQGTRSVHKRHALASREGCRTVKGPRQSAASA
jgi:GNAT superfamily N-acetyltransferase